MSPGPTSPDEVELADRVHAAIADVDDPELPGVSIVELGLVEQLDVDDEGGVRVGLVPTFSGCPALEAIRRDVATALACVSGVRTVEVEFLATPVWSIDRVSDAARRLLADGLGIAVEMPHDGSASVTAPCPQCGAATVRTSVFGPTRCRAVHRCAGCREVVEVMRR